MNRSWYRAAAVVCACSLIAASCGGDDDDDAGPASSAPSSEDSGATPSEPEASTPASAAATSDTETSAPEDSSPAAADDVDPDGVLRLPIGLQTLMPSYDPANPTPPNPNYSPVIMVYDTLLRPTGELGALEPGLAKEVNYVDSSTITIVLQDDVMFSDGTPFDAEAVKTGIEYLRDSESNVLAPERKAIETITVDSPTELTLSLSQPLAGEIINLMAYSDFLIPSPAAIAAGNLAENPIGAGPFLLQENVPGEKITLVKNPDYFEADRIRVGTVEWINTPVGEALVNSLASGAVDVGEAVPYQLATQLEGSDLTVEYETSDNALYWGQMCKSRPPFDDVRVRQALNYATDRDALNNVIFAGEGAPMWGLFQEGSPFYVPELVDSYAYNPEKAKELLAEAGASDLSFEMFTTPGGPDRAAEVLQSQWAESGITVTLKPMTNSLDFFPDATGAPIALYQLGRIGIQRVVRPLGPGSFANVCNYGDVELQQAVADVEAAEPGSDEQIEAWNRVQTRLFDQAAALFTIFGVSAKVYNPDRVGDVSFMPNVQGGLTVNYFDVYVKE